MFYAVSAGAVAAELFAGFSRATSAPPRVAFLAAYSIAAKTFARVSKPNSIHAKAMIVVRILPCLPGPARERLGHLCVAIAPPTSHIIHRMRLRALSPCRKPRRFLEGPRMPRKERRMRGIQVIVRIEVTSSSTMIGSAYR